MAKLTTPSTAHRSITRRTTLNLFLHSNQGRAFFAQVQAARRKSARLVKHVDQRLPVDDCNPEQLLKLRLALHCAHAKLETAEQIVRFLMLASVTALPQRRSGDQLQVNSLPQQL